MAVVVTRVPTAITSSASAWHAELDLRFGHRADRTVLLDRRHQGPLLVQRPFYPAANECHVYLLHPPAGIVGGDELQINITVDANAQALITTPAANKFYRSDGRIARLQQRFTVSEGAALEWLPQETLFFEGARAECHTELHLHEQACFIGWEAQCFGRPCAAERFEYGQVDLAWSIRGSPQARLHERLRLDPQALTAVWGLRGMQAMASFYAYPANKDCLEQTRSMLAEQANSGCTLLDSLLVCRLLGEDVTALRQTLERLWHALRPVLLQRPACPPRIWAT